MSNLFARFKRLLPDPPLMVGEIIAIADGTATVELPGGGLLKARGDGSVGDKVFVRDGVIESQAPSLPIEIIEV